MTSSLTPFAAQDLQRRVRLASTFLVSRGYRRSKLLFISGFGPLRQTRRATISSDQVRTGHAVGAVDPPPLTIAAVRR
jgi:hypothetical protein